MTVMQRVAICFAAGVVGAPAEVVLSHIMFALGLSQKLGVMAPVSLKSPGVYKPLFWGGLWGIPFGLFAVYLLPVSLPFGIVTALVAKAIVGEKP